MRCVLIAAIIGVMTSTGRLYIKAQTAFVEWCHTQSVNKPTHDDIARYLQFVWDRRGPSSVPVHLSAIAEMFRAHGMPLDTKATVIQNVVASARAKLRGAGKNTVSGNSG